MLSNLFADPVILIQGAITGLILGLLLQKGKLSQFNVIVGQFLFKDFTVLKVIMTAIIVGSIGIYSILWIDLPIPLFIKPISTLAIVIGGAMFGIGIVVLGYCPATCVAAAAQGCRDAWWGICGMLFGALIYAELYEIINKYILSQGAIEATTLPQAFGLSAKTIIVTLIVLSIILFKLVDKKKLIKSTEVKTQETSPPLEETSSETK